MKSHYRLFLTKWDFDKMGLGVCQIIHPLFPKMGLSIKWDFSQKFEMSPIFKFKNGTFEHYILELFKKLQIYL